MASPPYGANNNIFLATFPITEDTEIRNIFRSFPENKIILGLADNQANTTITKVSSTVIRLDDGQANVGYLTVGDTVTIKGGNNGLYDGKSGVITDDNATDYEVAIDYVGDDSATDYFKNRLANDYHLEYRFIVSGTEDVQVDIPVLVDSTFNIFQDSTGTFEIDANLMRSLLVPDLDFNPILPSENSMNLKYQIQIREVEDNAAIGSWETVYDSAITTFEQFIITHATGISAKFTDQNILLESEFNHRAWHGYPVIYSYVADVNSNVTINIEEIEQNKTSLATTSPTPEMLEGITNITYTIVDSSARYLKIENDADTSNFVNFTIHETNQDDTEFFIKWLSQNGNIRSWLFVGQVGIDETFDSLDFDFGSTPVEGECIKTVTAGGLSSDELNYIKDISGTNLIQVTNNGNDFNVRLDSRDVSYDNQLNTYTISLELSFEPIRVMNV